MSDPKAPDFAMHRAVEILSTIFERTIEKPQTPSATYENSLTLCSESLTLAVGSTTQDQVERKLGIAFAYPARGWHTYCCKGPAGERDFLSLFYSRGHLASAELYVPKSELAPSLAARDVQFRLLPGEISIGSSIGTLPSYFTRVSQTAEQLGAFRDILGTRFPGGSAFAMGNAGTIERIALYTLP